MIKKTLVALDVDTSEPLQVDFGYRPDYPLEVRMRFRNIYGQSVTWVIERDELSKGMDQDSGTMDVLVTPVDDNHSLSITLVGMDFAAEYYVEKDDVYRFLVDSYDAVPPGSETKIVSASLDRFLEEILTNGA